jgi:hypothetical protein
MSLRRWFGFLALAVSCLALAPAVAAQSLPPCTFSALFQPLQDSAPVEIGSCRGAQLAESNGDALQVTTKGLLVWRKADNWMGFVGSSRTLVMTPDGLARRLNTDRFDWELDGLTPEEGMFTSPVSGLLPASMVGLGFETTASTANEMMASATINRPAQDRLRDSRAIVQTIQVLPTAELAHSLFVDLGNLQQSDMLLKTTRLGDETEVAAWKPDDVGSYSATFRQLALRARKSNAVVTVVLVPGTRVDTAVQLASMIFGRLR